MNEFMQMFSLKDKVSLITGGGRGIGKGIATVLASAGSDIILVSRTKSQLNETAEEIRHTYHKDVLPISGDVCNFETHETIINESVSKYGKIDILINNAGANIRKPFWDVTYEDYKEISDLHVTSTFFLSQKVSKIMSENNGGKIVNLASLTSKIGIPSISVYGTAKGAVYSLTKSLSVELASQNINVNAVAPGYIHTSMTDPVFQDSQKCQSMLMRIPLKRFGSAQDIGYTVLFLCSKAAHYITGEVIFVDGGWMAS